MAQFLEVIGKCALKIQALSQKRSFPEFECMKNLLLANKLSGVCWSMATVSANSCHGQCGIIQAFWILSGTGKMSVLIWGISCRLQPRTCRCAGSCMLAADWFCCFLFMWLSLDECATGCILATCAFLIAIQFFFCFSCPQVIKSPLLLSSIKIIPVQKAKVLSVESLVRSNLGTFWLRPPWFWHYCGIL